MSSNSVTEKSLFNFESCYKNLKEGVNAGRRFLSLDRSHQVFGDTDQAQLKGRSEFITKTLALSIVVIAVIALLALGAHFGILSFSGLTGLAITGLSLGLAINLVEIAIQSIARSQEKLEAGITEETPDTQYTLRELSDELGKSFRKELDAYHEALHRLTNTLFVPHVEASSQEYELELLK